jgi:osmotically-inducible protein OsmY
MADRWRDDDRDSGGYQGSTSEHRQAYGRPRSDFSDYDPNIQGRDYRGGPENNRPGRDAQPSYFRGDRQDGGRDYDDYVRSDQLGSYGDYGPDRGQGGRYQSSPYQDRSYRDGGYRDRPDQRYSQGRTGGQYPTGRAYGGDRSEHEQYGRGRIDGLRGYREYGYDLDNDRQQNSDRGLWDRTRDEVRSWFGDDDAERRRERDHYRGHGPKGYNRSDDRVREDVCDRLSDDPRIDASDIEVSVSDGEVTLSGTIRDRILKRRVEDVVDDISGVKNVQNNLRVSQSSDYSATRSGSDARPSTPPAAGVRNVSATDSLSTGGTTKTQA